MFKARLVALWALFVGLSPAHAGDPPFSITTGSGTFEISASISPRPRALPLKERICRVLLAWTDARIDAKTRDCRDEVAREVLTAVQQWSIRAPTTLTGRHELGELWFVYPTDETAHPRLFVRQSHERELSLPRDVDVVPFMIGMWSFLRWPDEVYREDHPDIHCDVDVESDERGITKTVSITNCEEPFYSATLHAIRQWRFEPILVDGFPLPTAITLTATFVAHTPTDPERPSEESRQLWIDRQFGALTHEERMWFIHEALFGDDTRDLGPGRVLVRLPRAPHLGDRDPPRWEAEAPPLPPLPDHPPSLVLGAPDHPSIDVYTMDLPQTELSAARCSVVVQVDHRRQVISWADEDCEPSMRSLAIGTADDWQLALSDTSGASASYARFHARLEIDANGAMQVVLPADELRSAADGLPAGVHTERPPGVLLRVPPRLSRGAPIRGGICEMSVEIDVRGRPRRVTLLEASEASCPEEVRAAALAAAKRWRWSPAERDGTPVPSTGRTVIRFQE